MNASDVLVESLIDWGVDTIFGIPGDGINGVMEALRVRQEKVRFIQVRHEEAAALAAVGYAKFTGRLGVCLATSGPGGIHLLNGLYDAKFDGVPVLAITGSAFSDLTGTFTQQDIELDKVFMDACTYNQRIMGATHVENAVDQACRTALAYHVPVHITIASDLQEQECSKRERSERNLPRHAGKTAAERTDKAFHSGRMPDLDELERAADVLNAGKKVAIMAGQGALRARAELEKVAELLGAPIIKPLLGKCAVPDDSPYTTGGIGLLGTAPSQEALEDCDTLLIVGSTFPYIEFYPRPGQARAVQIEIDPKRVGLRYPVEVGLVADAAQALQELVPLLKPNDDRRFLKQAQAGMKDWRETMRAQATNDAKPMKPQVVAASLGERLRSDAIVCCDSGTITSWFARFIPAKEGQMQSLSGTLATMACAVPYAIGAQVAHPQRQVVAFVGDGGFAMLMAEFATAVKYHLPIKVVVIKNGTLGQIKWEQMVFLGNPEYQCELHPIDFAEVAHACGGIGLTCDDPANIHAAMDELLSAPGPALLEAVVDPFEPPMPPKISAKQALKFAESLAKGQPNRGKIALTVAKDRVREMI